MADAPPNRPVLLYGILSARARDDEALQSVVSKPGVQNAPLMLLSCGPLAALASPVEKRSVLRQPDVDTVLTFKDIVDAAHRAHPLVPLRFGVCTDSPAEARTLIAERREACRAQLDTLAERVEMGLRLEAKTRMPEAASDAQEAPSGTAYLEARKARLAQDPLRRAAQQYRNALASLAVDVASDGGEGGALSMAFLVPCGTVDAFRQRAEQVSVETVERDIVGPWAPFTFASLSL